MFFFAWKTMDIPVCKRSCQKMLTKWMVLFLVTHIKIASMCACGSKETRSQNFISGSSGLRELTNFHRWGWTTRNWRVTKKTPIATSSGGMENSFSRFPCSVPFLGDHQKMLCGDVHCFMYIWFFSFWHPNDHMDLTFRTVCLESHGTDWTNFPCYIFSHFLQYKTLFFTEKWELLMVSTLL